MEVITNYLKELLEWIPKEVILSVFIVVVITEITKKSLEVLEKKLEEKKQKQIKFFDHTKVIFVTVWSVVIAIILVVSGVYKWQQLPLYFFVIFGASVILYEYIVKKIKKIWS
jgi:hypothetical protein